MCHKQRWRSLAENWSTSPLIPKGLDLTESILNHLETLTMLVSQLDKKSLKVNMSI